MRIKKMVACLLFMSCVLYLGLSPADAGERKKYEEKFEKTVSLAKDGKVIVGNISGNIEVKTWNRDEVKIEALKVTKTDSDEQAKENFEKVTIEISQEGKTLRIETKYAKNYFRGKNKNMSVSYWLMIPAQAQVSAKSVSGDILMAKIGGSAKADSVSGDLDLSEMSGMVNGKSISGEITLIKADKSVDCSSISGTLKFTDIGGDADLNSISGDVILDDCRGNVEAETVSGNVKLQGITKASSVKAKSLSGDVRYYGNIYENGSYTFKSHSGDVQMEIPANSAFELVSKTFSGDIHTDFDITISGKLGRRSLRGTVNGGGADISINTFSGDVYLKKS